MNLNSCFTGKVTTCADVPNTSTTHYLSTNADTTKLITFPDIGVCSIVKASITKDILTLEVDAGAYRAVEKMADAKKGSRKDSDRLKRDVRNIVDRENIRRRQKISRYEDDLETWKSTPEDTRGERPNKPKHTNEIKPSTFDPYLVTEGEKRAYIKSYFLYEYLIQDMKLSGRFTCEDFNQALRFSDKENIAVDDGGRKVRKMLGLMDGVLYIDTSAYIESAKKKRYNNLYEYKFHSVMYVKDPNGKTQKIQYRIPSLLKSHITLQNQFKSNPELILELESVQKIFKRYNVKSSLESLSPLTTPTNPYNELNISSKDFEFQIYIPDYSKLELNGLPQSVLFECYKPEKLNVWIKNHNNPAKITSCSRLWHPFHGLPRLYRKHITYNGSPLVEAMDVRGCYYVLMSKALEVAENVNAEELSRFKKLVRCGDIYSEMGRHVKLVGCEENDVANYAQEEYLSFLGMDIRSQMKLDMQSFRNIKTFGQAENQYPMLARYFKQQFPTITEWLFSYPVHVNSEGETVKRLQHDMSRIETMLISKVCFKLREMGVTPFTLHDAVYLSEKELSTLDDGTIERVFWEAYDTTTPDEIRMALGEKSSEEKSAKTTEKSHEKRK